MDEQVNPNGPPPEGAMVPAVPPQAPAGPPVPTFQGRDGVPWPSGLAVPIGAPEHWGRCIEFVLDQEGGFQKRADDSGNWTGGHPYVGDLVGTNFGISAASYPKKDIQGLTRPLAEEIYWRDYFTQVSCDKMPFPLALAVFDSAVNQGVGWAARALQKLLNVNIDGRIGMVTIMAVRAAYSKKLVRAFLVQRLIAYCAIHNDAWKAEWFDRIIDVADVVLEDSLYA